MIWKQDRKGVRLLIKVNIKDNSKKQLWLGLEQCYCKREDDLYEKLSLGNFRIDAIERNTGSHDQG